jgi:hypothetical protein
MKSTQSFSAVASERIVAAGVSALCRITPFSSLSLQGFYELCAAGPLTGYSGTSEIFEWVTHDLESYRNDPALVQDIADTWPENLPIQHSCLRLIDSLARDNFELRYKLIADGGFPVVFNAMETFRDDTVLQQTTHSAVRQQIAQSAQAQELSMRLGAQVQTVQRAVFEGLLDQSKRDELAAMLRERGELAAKLREREERAAKQQSTVATVATLIQNARACLDRGQRDEAEESLGQARQALAHLVDGGGDTLQQVVDMPPEELGSVYSGEWDEGADRDFALLTLRFRFLVFTPPGYLLEMLLDRLCTDISYLSELDALTTLRYRSQSLSLAESAHKAHVSQISI